jgi:methylenetetrahydrofolate dehydrogenase (NADP+)/methenyltetrahydrofolate cyclohydrolase
MVIDGRKLQQEILGGLIEERKKFGKIVLAVIAVGDEKNYALFIKAKQDFAKKLHVDFRVYNFSDDLNRKELRKKISQIVKAKPINGVVIQLPLPQKYPSQYFLNAIIPEKDVDCLSAKAMGLYFTDTAIIKPPAVEAVNFIKEKFNLDFSSKFALVVGYGNLIGKPIVHYLLRQGATVLVINSKTTESVRSDFFKKADIIVSGVGKKNIIIDCKSGAVIIDFGYSINPSNYPRINSFERVVGDVDFEKLKDKVGLITSTPGGTGPILVAMLYKNLLKLIELQTRQ